MLKALSHTGCVRNAQNPRIIHEIFEERLRFLCPWHFVPVAGSATTSPRGVRLAGAHAATWN